VDEEKAMIQREEIAIVCFEGAFDCLLLMKAVIIIRGKIMNTRR